MSKNLGIYIHIPFCASKCAYCDFYSHANCDSLMPKYHNAIIDHIKEAGLEAYFVDHTAGIYPASAGGIPWTASYIQSTGDTFADLHEDLAAEQKARKTYDNILRFATDPDVRDPIKFLRERELVHFQRFGDALRIVQDNLDYKNFYAFNPSFDMDRKKMFD